MKILFTRIAPVLSILSFIAGFVLYLVAANLYPGGGGEYYHLSSYWCELYNTHPGLVYAKASTLALVASLFFFWLAVPVLFSELKRLAIIVRLAGVFASVAASLVFTDLHDKVITMAVPLGFAAIVGTCVGLARKKERFILILAIAAVSIGTASYSLWMTGTWKAGQPYVQKIAIILIFLWVVLGAAKVLTRRPAKAAAGFPVIASP